MKITNKDYLIINLALVFIFIIGFFYLFFSNNTMTCYYKEHYSILCETCGLTRDFKSILNFNTTDLINPISIDYFKSFVLIFFSRLISVFMIFKKTKNNLIIAFELFIGILIIIQFL